MLIKPVDCCTCRLKWNVPDG